MSLLDESLKYALNLMDHDTGIVKDAFATVASHPVRPPNVLSDFDYEFMRPNEVERLVIFVK